jgi:integrase
MYKLDYSVDAFLSQIYSRSQSEESKKGYRTGMKRFEEFVSTKFPGTVEEFVEQIKSDNTDINMVLRDFVRYLIDKGYSARSISAYVAAAKKYLRFCGIRIYNEDFKQVVTMPRKMKVKEIPLTKEILVRLLRNTPPKLQPVILVAISSGMRISELVQLTISDIDFSSTPTKIRIRAETTKTRTERETFITAEATNALKDYLRRYQGWEEGKPNTHLLGIPIFGRSLMKNGVLRDEKTLKQASVLASKGLLQKSLERAIKQIPDLCIKNENGISAIHFHNFRKFFRTTVGNECGRDFAEALIGHEFYMDTYYQLPEDKKRELYLKAEPYLTISDFKTVEKNFDALSERCRQLEQEVANFKKYRMNNSVEVPSFLNKEQLS